MAAVRSRSERLPPEVNRILYVRNLPFNISSEDMYRIFGDFGGIRQVRLGTSKESRGTAYVVFDDIYDAKVACDKLSGFNVQNRFLICLYFNPARQRHKTSLKKDQQALADLQAKHGVDGEQHARPKKGGTKD